MRKNILIIVPFILYVGIRDSKACGTLRIEGEENPCPNREYTYKMGNSFVIKSNDYISCANWKVDNGVTHNVGFDIIDDWDNSPLTSQIPSYRNRFNISSDDRGNCSTSQPYPNFGYVCRSNSCAFRTTKCMCGEQGDPECNNSIYCTGNMLARNNSIKVTWPDYGSNTARKVELFAVREFCSNDLKTLNVNVQSLIRDGSIIIKSDIPNSATDGSRPFLVDCQTQPNTTTYKFFVDEQPGVGNYQWVIPSGWSYYIPTYDGAGNIVQYTAFTQAKRPSNLGNEITLISNGNNQGGIISVKVDRNCSASFERTQNIQISTPPPNPITFLSPNQCNLTLLTSVSANASFKKFIWDAPAIVNPNNSAIATFSWSNNPQVATTIKVKADYGRCGTSAYTTRILPPPGIIIANATSPIQLVFNSYCTAQYQTDVTALRTSSDLLAIEWTVWKLNSSYNGYDYNSPASRVTVPVTANINTFTLNWNSIAPSPSYKISSRAIYRCGGGTNSFYPSFDPLGYHNRTPFPQYSAANATQPLTCYLNGSNTFVSTPAMSASPSSPNYVRDFQSYSYELRETGTTLPATLARFSNNATSITNTASNSVSVNYNGQKSFDLCVKPNSSCINFNYICNTIQPYQGATDIAITSQPPILSDQFHNFAMLPSLGVNYSLSIAPKEISSGSINSVFSGGSTSMVTSNAFTVKVGQPLTKGFVVTANTPAFNGCPAASFSKTFDMISDYNIGLAGVNFSIYGTNVVNKNFIRVPDNMSISGLERLDFDVNPMTFEAWILASTTQNAVELATIFSNYEFNQHTGIKFGIKKPSNKLALLYYGRELLSTSTAYNLMDAKCHHVAFTRNGTDVKFYVDGVLTDSFIIPAMVNFSSPNVRGYVLGNENTQFTQRISGLPMPASNFNGMIREVRVWRVARLQAEIINNTFKEIKPVTSELVSYLRLNEGVGTIAYETREANLILKQINGLVGFNTGIYSMQPSWSKLTCTPSIAFRKGFSEDSTLSKPTEIKIYPNPTSGVITIVLPMSIEENDNFASATIVDLTGQILFTTSLKNYTTEIDVTESLHGAKGIFILKVTNKGKIQVFKLVVNP